MMLLGVLVALSLATIVAMLVASEAQARASRTSLQFLTVADSDRH